MTKWQEVGCCIVLFCTMVLVLWAVIHLATDGEQGLGAAVIFAVLMSLGGTGATGAAFNDAMRHTKRD